jgi:hypothetical protein
VTENAELEPYAAFRHYDAFTQVRVGTTAMFLWGAMAVAIIIWGATRPTVISSLPWVGLLLWIIVCQFYLYESVSGYLDDISHFVLHQ